MTYAGDVSPNETWRGLTDDAASILIDVRTRAEWMLVGTPTLSSLGKKVVFIEWQGLDGAPNPDFSTDLEDVVGGGFIGNAYFICRSGARSRDAAIAMTAQGWKNCFNVADGFEGPVDENRQRGHLNGWKADGLPWFQN